MAKKEFKCSYRYNEKEVTKSYFEFKEDIRNSLYYRVFTRDYNQVVLSWVNKYLLHVKKVKPIVAQELIRKYVIIFVYSWLRDRFDYVKVNEFDEILSKPLSIENLFTIKVESSDDYLAMLFNDLNIYRDKEKNKEFESKIKKCEISDKIISLIKKVHIEFFIIRYDELLSMEAKDVKQIDQIVSEGITNNYFYDFKIEIDEENFENYQANIVNESNKSAIKERIPVIFGMLVNNLITNNNYDMLQNIDVEMFRDFPHITLDKNDTIFIKKPKPSMKINFINIDGSFNKSKIVPFEFIFNNQRYAFSNGGLRRR